MEETRRTIQNLLCALAAPFVVIFMVALALLTGLAYYLIVVIQGIWFLFRELPRWILNFKTKPPLQEPHFLRVPAPGKPVE